MPRRSTLPLPLLALLLTLAAATPAGAQGLRVESVSSDGVRVDGSLREWGRTRFVPVGEGRDASMEVALRHDADGVLVGARVWDERMVRTERPGAREDAVVLTLAMPAGRGRYRGVDVWLWAGIPGRQAASMGVSPVGRGARARPVQGGRIVEGPLGRGEGYVLEAYVPFAAIPGGARWEQGRIALRLQDVDSEARPEVENAPATAEVDPRALDRLPAVQATGGSSGMLSDFLRSRSIGGTRPTHDFRGNVSGDARPERVVVVRHYVVVMGPGYRDGERFDFLELPVVSAAGVRDAELVDLTGDGADELVVTVRQTNDQGSRDLWQVYGFTGEAIRPLFAVELRKQTSEGFVEARLRLRRARRGPPLVEVRTGRVERLDAESFREAPARDAQPILVPWGPVLARSYQWDGQRFDVVRERENPRAAERSEPPRSAPAGGNAEPSREPQQPQRPSNEDLIAAFKRQAGIPRERPRFMQEANVAEGREAEAVMVFGKSLLVVGPGFRGGTGWFHFDLPAESAEDVLSMDTADLTGDGRQELLMRIRRESGDVSRELLLVHQFRPTGFPRLLAVEVARQEGPNRIENQFRVRRGHLEVHPGGARGWDASSWPFADGTGDGVDPLLLPWRDQAVRYDYRGGQLVR